MKLQTVNFGSVWQASGATNFYDEGYWFHKLLYLCGLSWKGATFVAKTITLHSRAGNMALKPNSTQPKEWFPKCIHVDHRRQFTGNAVGLSNWGAEWHLNQNRWNKRTEPFFLSFMPVENTSEKRVQETREFAEILRKYIRLFQSAFGLQLNLTCPNTGHAVDDLGPEAEELFAILSQILNVPIVGKVNVLLDVTQLKRLARCEACAAIHVSNTVHWDSLPRLGINRKKILGTDVSPLAKFGGGGFSGAFMFPFVVNWVKSARANGFNKPINAGGGILKPADVGLLKTAGADGISLGSIGLLAPHQVRPTVREGHRLWQ